MSICLTFLGTGAAVPTIERSLPAVIISRGKEQIMFDCGEGVQRQIMKAKTGLHKPLKILITHMHGDHVLGLPGLLQTMALMDRRKPVDVYGPEGIAQFITCLRETLQFNLTYEVNIHEIFNSGIICDELEYVIEAQQNNHAVNGFCYAVVEKPRPGRFNPSRARELGIPEGLVWSKLQQGQEYKLPSGQIVKPSDVSGPVRKGRKIVYTGDTKTFDDELFEKASLDGHSTPSQAAMQAKAANAKQLLLTHISARYTDTSLLLLQARKIFPNTVVATDFFEIELPLSK